MKYQIVLICVALSIVPLVAHAQTSASAEHAQKLCALLSAQHLDAIAAQDPADPNHFVAALFYPNAQLLVISARYDAPQSLQGLLASKSYRDVYADLQTAKGASNQVMFIDMQADGLSEGRANATDVMYEPGNQQTVFDDNWRKQHGLNERQYLDKFHSADQTYAALLDTLSAAVPASMASK